MGLITGTAGWDVTCHACGGMGETKNLPMADQRPAPCPALRALIARALRDAANLKTPAQPAPSYAAGLHASQAVAQLREAIRTLAAQIEAGT